MSTSINLFSRIVKRRNFYLSSTIITTLMASTSVVAQVNKFDIPSQPLEDALNDFARQAEVEILYASDDVRAIAAPAISGAASREQAIAQLLAGTGLTYRFTEAGTLIVRASEKTSANAFPQKGRIEMARVAQPRAAGTAALSMRAAASDGGVEEGRRDEIEEMVVTGSNIRGVVPASSPLLVFDRSDIDRSGFATVPQLIESLPQNVAGAFTDVSPLVGIGGNAAFNTAIDLRGLGPDATLTLINGRRVAPSGEGVAVDISVIPLSALERVEILTDGASAIYGTDAVAGVVNFVLRDDFDGAETTARFGTVTDGGLEEYRVSQALGRTWASGNFLISYEYFNRDNLKAADRDFAASCDLTPIGGENRCPSPTSFAFNSGTSPATLFGTNGFFTVPDGQDGTSLSASDLIVGAPEPANAREDGDIIPALQRHSVFARGTQELGERFEVFLEGAYSRRETQSGFFANSTRLLIPVTNPFLSDEVANAVGAVPFGFLGGELGIQANYSFAGDFGVSQTESESEAYYVTGGVSVSLSETWQGEIFGSFSNQIENLAGNQIGSVFSNPALLEALGSSDPATAFNPFGDGGDNSQAVLDAILGSRVESFDTDILTFGGKADGSVFALPGGDVKLAVGAEYREEGLISSLVNTFGGAADRADGDSLERGVTSVFAEVFIPLVGPRNRMPGVERFEISAGGRYEHYDDVGDTANPKVGAIWTPVEGINIRGTYGTSFQAPLLTELDETLNRFVILQSTADPLSTDGTTNIGVFSGGNADLDPESARSWSVGVQLAPQFLPGFSLDVTYFDIAFEDRIVIAATSSTFVFQQLDLFGDLVSRRPTDSAALAAFEALVEEGRNSPGFAGDFSGGAPVEAIVDLRIRNQARTEISGIDFQASYGFDTAVGSFDFGINGSYLLDFQESPIEGEELVELVDTILNPVDLRMRGSAGWSLDGAAATFFVNYTDSYTDNQLGDEEAVQVDSHTTVDLTLSYDTQERFGSRWLDNTVFQLSVLNLFDEEPPFVNFGGGNGAFGFDPARASPLGRFIAFQISKKW